MKQTTRKTCLSILFFSLILGITAVAFAMATKPPENAWPAAVVPLWPSLSLLLPGVTLLFLGKYLRKKLPTQTTLNDQPKLLLPG